MCSPLYRDDVRVLMRDGVALSTNIFLPTGEGPFPVLLVRTPYDATTGENTMWINHGYAVVRQDVRGRYRSEGEDLPWLNEKADAEDTLDWLVQQPWCNGKIAMYGGSYVGATQVAAARTGHTALQCITPTLIGAELYHRTFWGGALRYGWLARWTLRAAPEFSQECINWALPVSDADILVRGEPFAFWSDILKHPTNDEFWQKDSLAADVGTLRAPAFIRTGWFDLFIADAFELYHSFRNLSASESAREGTRMIVGPWPHDINQTKVGDVDFGQDGKIADLMEQEIRFIDHFTKEDANAPLPAGPIRIFVMGANQWRDECEWPLARTQWTRFYLASEGGANSAHGNGRIAATPAGPPDHYSYDPSHPVPTLGGAWDFTNIGLKDQRSLDHRPDILAYTSAELTEPMEVTGPVSAELYVSSSAPDTDFTVKLVDIAPDGCALGVTDGIIRARYRNGNPSGDFLQPDTVYKLTIHCPPTSYVFRKGHRIRIQISSSNFPVFARNLNSEAIYGTETDLMTAHQTVHHTPDHPSCIILPVIPNENSIH